MDYLIDPPWPQITGTLGLLLDIVGVLILINTGLPSKSIRMTAYVEMFDREMAKRYDRWSFTALALVVFGFLLQIAGLWMQTRL